MILSVQNKKDIDEIDQKYIKGIQIHYVDTIEQVIDLALLDEQVDNPLFIN